MKCLTARAILAFTFMMTISLLSSASFAADDHAHTPDVCSAKDKKVCAHLGLPEVLGTKTAGKFIVDIRPEPKGEVTGLKVKLWMPDMNHGSLPVKIEPAANNHFNVSDVRFSMAGQWLVKLDFMVAKKAHHIEIPLDIKD